DLQLREAIDGVGKALEIEWPALEGLGGTLDVGGQDLEPPTTALELGGAAGFWPVSGEHVSGGQRFTVSGGLGRSDVRASTPAKGMKLRYPADPAAEGVLAGVLPALRWAWVPEPEALAFGPDPDGDGSVRFAELTYAPVVSGDAAAFDTARVTFELPVGSTAGGQPLTITIGDAELSGSVDEAGVVHP